MKVNEIFSLLERANEDYYTVSSFKQKVKQIFSYLDVDVFISTHFFTERLQGREVRESIEDDALDVIERVAKKYRQYLEEKKNSKKDIYAVMKSSSKQLSIVVNFNFSDKSKQYKNGIRFITIHSGSPAKFLVKTGDAKLIVEEKTPKQPKKYKNINNKINNTQSAALRNLYSTLKRVQYEE